MAVYSMTGYAIAASAAPSREGAKGAAVASVTVEARSVNGRFLDLAFRLPDELRGLEPALRDRLTAAFRRGKVELRIATAREGDSALPQPTPEQLDRLAELQGLVAGRLPQARPLSVNEALNWCRGGAGHERLDEPALEAAARCIEGLREARAREGARLAGVLMERVTRLRELAAQARPLVPQVVQRQQARFLERWHEALAAAPGGQALPAEALHERAMAEAVAVAIRIDVAEELARLASHLDEIERLLQAGGELGKRLADDAVVICDGGDFASYAGKFVEVQQPGCWLDTGPYGCLGNGLGYAIASRVVRPSSQVVALLGDGAAGFSLMDVDSLVRHRLPVVMVVGNNGMSGLEKHPMQAIYGWDMACDLQPGCRYDQVVTALGGGGELVTSPDQIGPALDRAFASGVPYLVNIVTDPADIYPRSSNLA